MTQMDDLMLPEPASPEAYRQFSVAQMYEFAKQAVLAEREACAKVCEDKERRKWAIIMERGSLEGFGPLDCAAAIRARTSD